jgi:hypothetical protein
LCERFGERPKTNETGAKALSFRPGFNTQNSIRLFPKLNHSEQAVAVLVRAGGEE